MDGQLSPESPPCGIFAQDISFVTHRVDTDPRSNVIRPTKHSKLHARKNPTNCDFTLS